MKVGNSGTNYGQIVNAENIHGDVSYNASGKWMTVEKWKELSDFIKKNGSSEHADELHDLRQHLAEQDEAKATSVWTKLRAFLSPFLTHVASIAQIVGTIDGLIHGKR